MWKRLSLMFVSVDYNYLESSFLVCGVVILIAGMVFTSNGFDVGSVGYGVMTAVTATVILVCVAAFAGLLSFEIYRAVVLAVVHDMARVAEVEAIERSLRQRRMKPTRGHSTHARRSTLLAKFTLRRRSGYEGGGHPASAVPAAIASGDGARLSGLRVAPDSAGRSEGDGSRWSE